MVVIVTTQLMTLCLAFELWAELRQEFVSCETGLCAFATGWLNLVFPFGALCLAIHHATPGAGARRAVFPKWLEGLFWANSAGWLLAGGWVFHTRLGLRFFPESIWWLFPWLWS